MTAWTSISIDEGRDRLGLEILRPAVGLDILKIDDSFRCYRMAVIIGPESRKELFLLWQRAKEASNDIRTLNGENGFREEVVSRIPDSSGGVFITPLDRSTQAVYPLLKRRCSRLSCSVR